MIVLFGATGHTGRLVARRLVADGARPVLAGRSAKRLAVLADELGGLEWRVADVERPASVAVLAERGSVLVTTVGPFTRWGRAALRAAVAAGATYVDSTGEPAFLREVFTRWDAPARAAGATLLTAMGYDYVPGSLAGALALEAAGEAAVRVAVGYFAAGTTASAGTRRSALGVALEPGHAFRDGELRPARAGEAVRRFEVDGREETGVSLGGAEHFALPAAYARLRAVEVYLGVPDRLVGPLRVATRASALAGRLPGARAALGALGDRVLGGGGEIGGAGRCRVVAVAEDAAGAPLARVELAGPDPYAFTAGLLSWTAHQAAAGALAGPGALGPLAAAGGLAALEAGCAQAGLTRAPAAPGLNASA